MHEYRLFLGNPGVGKSTLVNCILERRVFESGLNFGTGLTTKLQEHTATDGILYLDTPGLADVTIRQQAAKEIEKALRKGGRYKLFFLATLRNGRVSPEDITTFNQVVKAIDLPELEFSVVINNVKPRQFQMITENEDNFEKIAAGINAMDVKTTSITLVPVLDDLDEKTNAITPLPAAFRSFMNDAPSVTISPEQVRDIEVNQNQYARQLEENRRLLEDNNGLHAKIRELERRKPGFRRKIKKVLNTFGREVRAPGFRNSMVRAFNSFLGHDQQGNDRRLERPQQRLILGDGAPGHGGNAVGAAVGAVMGMAVRVGANVAATVAVGGLCAIM